MVRNQDQGVNIDSTPISRWWERKTNAMPKAIGWVFIVFGGFLSLLSVYIIGIPFILGGIAILYIKIKFFS